MMLWNLRLVIAEVDKPSDRWTIRPIEIEVGITGAR
jgi:hypothetical protein